MEGFIKMTAKFLLLLCWALPHEKAKIEKAVSKTKKENLNIKFIDDLSKLKEYIKDDTLVFLSTTKASLYPKQEEIIKLFKDFPQVQFCMEDYDTEYNPLNTNCFLDPLAGAIKNVYPRMIFPHIAIEAFITGEFPDPWAD